jgi:hypothetical protein
MQALSPISKNDDKALEEEDDEYEDSENDIQLSPMTTLLEILIRTVHKKIWIMTSCILDAMHQTRMTMVPMKKFMRRGSQPMKPKFTIGY